MRDHQNPHSIDEVFYYDFTILIDGYSSEEEHYFISLLRVKLSEGNSLILMSQMLNIPQWWCSEEQLMHLFMKIDANNKGEIGFDDFTSYLLSQQVLALDLFCTL